MAAIRDIIEHPSSCNAELNPSTCHILHRIPPELRLHIYRYVLIPEIPLHLEEPPPPSIPSDSKNKHKNGKDDKGSVSGDDDDWVDESESDSDEMISSSLLDSFRNEDGEFEYNGMDLDELEEAYYADELGPEEERIFEAMERQQLIDDGISDSDSDLDFDDEDLPERSGRDLAVLRTNRQIYNEASALFYSEATIVIVLDDLIDLAKQRPHHVVGLWQFVWMDTWRYHPILNPGKRDSDGNYEYSPNPTSKEIKMSRDHRHHTWTDCKVHNNEQALPRGKLFPHIFTRFQNINLVAIFEDDYIQQDTIWFDDEKFVIKQSDADNILKHVKTLTVIKDLVKFLTHSSKINLSITLRADIDVESTFLDEMEAESDFDSDTDDENEAGHNEKLQKMEKEDRIMDIANQRAAELLVDSTLFNPLKRLTNVSKFSIKFGGPLEWIKAGNSPESARITPSPKYKQVFAMMSKIIEGNYQEKVMY